MALLHFSGGRPEVATAGSGNSSGGAGIAHYAGEAQIAGTVVSANGTSDRLKSGGGGIWIHSGETLIGQGVVISDNRTGGGIWNDGGLEQRDGFLRANWIGGSDNDGGGLYNVGEAILVASTVAANQTSAAGTSADGGGIFSLATLTLRNITVSPRATSLDRLRPPLTATDVSPCFASRTGAD